MTKRRASEARKNLLDRVFKLHRALRKKGRPPSESNVSCQARESVSKSGAQKARARDYRIKVEILREGDEEGRSSEEIKAGEKNDDQAEEAGESFDHI